MQGRSLTARANELGLIVPGEPNAPPELWHAVERENDRRNTEAVGIDTIRIILQAMRDVGLPHSEPWAWVTTGYLTADGGMIGGRLVVPSHIVGRDGMYPWTFTTPYPWDERYRGYTFELFGRLIRQPEDMQGKPPIWSLRVVEDPALDGPGILHIAVWRARVFHRDAAVHGRADWRPGWTEEVCSYSGITLGTAADVRKADLGLRLLNDIPTTHRGRQDGDGAYHHTDAAFLADLDEAIRRVQGSTRRAKPDARLVMRQMNYEKSAFYKRVKNATGNRWKDVAAEYELRGIQRN